MSLLLLSFGAGALTVLSPCVLPVLPFVFARPGSGRLFGGLAIGFGAVMLLATAGGAWAVQAHSTGRALALAMLGLFGLALTWPRFGTLAMQPLGWLAARIDGGRNTTRRAADWTIGLSTGLLWAPCAGPVLGVVLTTTALHGRPGVTAPLLAYAAGSAVALSAVRWGVARAGQRMPPQLLAALPFAEAARRVAGAVVLATVALIATGWDTRLAARLPGLDLEHIEENWLQRWSIAPRPQPTPADEAAAPGRDGVAAMTPAVLRPDRAVTAMQTASDVPSLPVLGNMPPLAGATAWLQSTPLGASDLRGKVVLVDFWTFACVNCQRALPSVRDWARRYKDEGLVVIGVHAPEFAFERDRGNVERALRRLDLDFAVAMDNDFAIWNAWSNRYWPTLYLVDAQGRLRWRHIGEGAYGETEQAIRQLLDEARRKPSAS